MNYDQEFVETVMENLKESVEQFKMLLSDVVNKKELLGLIAGKSYLQYAASNAVFYLDEMEKSVRDFSDFPLKDQMQISFWAVQMRDELERILGKNFIGFL